VHERDDRSKRDCEAERIKRLSLCNTTYKEMDIAAQVLVRI